MPDLDLQLQLVPQNAPSNAMSAYTFTNATGQTIALGDPEWMELDTSALQQLLALLLELRSRSPQEQRYVCGTLLNRLRLPCRPPKDVRWVEQWLSRFEAVWEECTLCDLHRVGVQYLLQCEGDLQTPTFRHMCSLLLTLVSSRRVTEFCDLLFGDELPTRAQLISTFRLRVPQQPLPYEDSGMRQPRTGLCSRQGRTGQGRAGQGGLGSRTAVVPCKPPCGKRHSTWAFCVGLVPRGLLSRQCGGVAAGVWCRLVTRAGGYAEERRPIDTPRPRTGARGLS